MSTNRNAPKLLKLCPRSGGRNVMLDPLRNVRFFASISGFYSRFCYLIKNMLSQLITESHSAKPLYWRHKRRATDEGWHDATMYGKCQ